MMLTAQQQAALYFARKRRRRAARVEIIATPVTTATVNVAYDGFTVQGAGGLEPYTYSAWGFPAGITIDPTTGEVSGTPTESGTFTPTVRAEDAAGYTRDLEFTLEVSA